MTTDLVEAATRWLEEDPDLDTRAELGALITARDTGALADRFGARLQFGTAGLRGALGAGPNRMNRVIVRRAAAGLARYLLDQVPGAAEAGVVIGCDARHKSDVFAQDTAAVLAGAGLRALLLPPRLPTPLLAFAVRHLGCAAGVMVTASHNPPADNGYKVYLGDGAQIVPPADVEISAAIDAVGPLSSVPLASLDDPLVTRLGSDIVEAFQRAEVALSLVPSARDVSVVYTAMHGVGRDQVTGVWSKAGFPPLHIVAAQADPDPDFPTVAFPNPEEPGALDLALADAARVKPDVLIANDPDADRLGVAIPDGSGYRALRGDEIGMLLGDHVLRHTSGSDRLVATTVVSSTMLSKMAAAAGVHYAETLTGFKWIARAALDRPGTRFVFGYEEALGYLVGDVVRDKDGISAAMVLAELTALAKAEGVSLQDRLDALAREHGLHATDQWSVRLEGAEGQARIASVMSSLKADPPGERAEPEGLPPADIVMVRIGDDRVVVRPSGTEPKLKMYFEVVIPVTASIDDARTAARAAAHRAARPDGESDRPLAQASQALSPGLSAQAEEAVSGVAEAGDDVCVLVQVIVDRGGDDVEVEAGGFHPLEPFGRSEHAHDRHVTRAAVGDQAAGELERSSGGEHRIEDDDGPAAQSGRQLGHVVVRFERLFVASQADEAHLGLGEQADRGVGHPEACAQDRDDDREAGQSHAISGAERRAHLRRLDREIARRLVDEHRGEVVDRAPERGPVGGLIAQHRELLRGKRMVDDSRLHARAFIQTPIGCQTVLVSRNASIRSRPGSRNQSGSGVSGLTTRLRFSAAARSRSVTALGGAPQRSIAFTSMCDASHGASSAALPVSMFTTPAGRSDVASTSVRVIAGMGPRSAATTTHVLPLTIAGATTETRPSSVDCWGATTATTPVGSGTEKSK